MTTFPLSHLFKFQHKSFWLLAFFVFFAGFFIFHGREAANSGSWRYILSHDDEYSYWASTETPISDANPFIYEERGATNSIPYTTVLLVGLIAKLLHLPVMFFFPIWHIGMPFLLWATLYLCMKKIWHYPPGISAALALLILLSTLFLRGSTAFTLFRYSRPGDGLGLLILSLSFIFNLDQNRKKYVVLAAVTSAAVLWLQAYYAILPLIAAFGEGCWQFFAQKKKRAALDFGLIILAISISGFLYFVYMKSHPSPWWIENIVAKDGLGEKIYLHAPSLILYGSLLFLIAAIKIYLRQVLTKWDRVVILTLCSEPLITHLRLFLNSDWQLSSHRYYSLLLS